MTLIYIMVLRGWLQKPIRENDIRALIDQIKELKANQKLLREELRALKDEQVYLRFLSQFGYSKISLLM
jgi:hypothetical protein